MNQEAGHACKRGRRVRAAPFAVLVAAIFAMAACSLSGPPPTEYVLGTMPAATPAILPQTGLQVIEVKRVQLPDYLDTTDILERKGNELIPRATGRWGERLSVGMTRALTASLAARLPRMVVTATPPLERPARQVLVEVAAFEPREDHQVVLVARWTVADNREVLVAEQVSLVEAIAGTDDSAVVTAMSRALDELAGRLAAAIRSDGRPG